MRRPRSARRSLSSVPGYPNSSITELKFPSLNPSGLLHEAKPKFRDESAAPGDLIFCDDLVVCDRFLSFGLGSLGPGIWNNALAHFIVA